MRKPQGSSSLSYSTTVVPCLKIPEFSIYSKYSIFEGKNIRFRINQKFGCLHIGDQYNDAQKRRRALGLYHSPISRCMNRFLIF
ncbi:hypothetical protein Y032_0282g1287 [Ancylostoma ceylanicum]|uniref:Uncharacterized protein n=1 Tax=Ancylostoma ceylanicum TaxID=53326 RepID=A0A016S6L7_9BILA|nr:hypothetical protein Y032_0282g1287 [Ancylostoma ceylanicum]